MQYGQLFGVPIRWANYPQNNKGQLQIISKALANMGAAGYGAFPDGCKLEMLEVKGNSSNIPQMVIIEKAEENVDLMLLGQTLTSKPGANGNRSLGEVHAEIRTDRVQHLAQWVCKTISTQLIAQVSWWNYGNTDMLPRMIVADEEAQNGLDMANRDNLLFVTMGIPVAVDYLYDRHSVPRPDPTDEMYVKPALPAPGGPPAKETGNPFGSPNDKADTSASEFSVRMGSLPIGIQRTIRESCDFWRPDALIPRTRSRVSDLLNGTEPKQLQAISSEVERMYSTPEAAAGALSEAVRRHHIVYVNGRAHGIEGIAALARICDCDPEVSVLDLTTAVWCETTKEPKEMPAEISDVIASMPADLAEYYLGILEVKGADVADVRHRIGSGKGGQYKAVKLAAAQAAVQKVIDNQPTYGNERGNRKLDNFGFTDHTTEWNAVGGRIPDDLIKREAGRVRQTTAVPLSDLKMTQRVVDCGKLQDMLEAGPDQSSTPVHRTPIVVAKGGQKWLYDGHHRAVIEKLTGGTDLRSRLVTLE